MRNNFQLIPNSKSDANRQILIQRISEQLQSLTSKELSEIEAFIKAKKAEIASGLPLTS